MKFLSAILLFLPLMAFSPSGNIPSHTINAEAEKMTTDNIGNVYLIKAESIFKYDASGRLQKTYSNKNYGNITSADATNALRIVLYYKDFNRVVFLDNMMSQIGDPLTLETIGFPLATLTASSYDNGLWIYDPQNFELVRLNRNLQVEHRSGNLSQILGIELQPNFLLEKDNRLFLNNPSTGILIFDVFGTYSKTIPVTNLKALQVQDNSIVFYQDGKMQAENILINDHINYTKPVGDSLTKDMRMEKNAVFVLKKKEVEIYDK
jgi:hypothetical protein